MRGLIYLFIYLKFHPSIQWRTEGFWRPGRRWKLAPLTPGVSDWQAPKSISLAIQGGVWGGAPATNAFWSIWEEMEPMHFWIAVTPFSTRRVRLTSAEYALPCYPEGGSVAEPQPPTLLRAFGCKWNSFSNCVNTIFNSACQTGKRRRRSLSLLGGLGRSPRHQRFWEHLGVNGTHFWIALTQFSTRLVRLASAEGALSRYWGVWGGAPAANAFGRIYVCIKPFFFNSVNDIFNSFVVHCGHAACDPHSIRIVSFSNSQRGAAPPMILAPAARHTYGAYGMCTKILGYTCFCLLGAPKCKGAPKR